MSSSNKVKALLGVIDSMLEVHRAISSMETTDVKPEALKKSLIEFRDLLSELGTASMAILLQIMKENPQSAKAAGELFTNLIPKGIPNSRSMIVTSILLIDMSIMNGNASRQQMNMVASMVANDAVANGLIDGVKIWRELLRDWS